VLFPDSYAQTTEWVRSSAEESQAMLAACQQQLQQLVDEDEQFQQLAAGIKVRLLQCSELAVGVLVSGPPGSRPHASCTPAAALQPPHRAPPACPPPLSPHLQVRARTKSMFSVMKKLLQLSSSEGRGKTRADIYDLHGLRAVVQPRADLPSGQAEQLAEQACFRLQQLAEAVWPPLQQRYKDYITSPKANGYRSLHLTLAATAGQGAGAGSSGSNGSSAEEDELTSRLNSNSRASSSSSASGGAGGGPGAAPRQQHAWRAWQPGPLYVELQIRTQLMDEQAELGAAAHAGYKGGLEARQAQQLQSWTQELQRRLLQQPQRKLRLPAPAAAGCLPAPEAAGPSPSPSPPGGGPNAELQAAQAAAEELFRHLDRDGDGRLSLGELQLVGGRAPAA
jgi:hypothetical protein